MHPTRPLGHRLKVEFLHTRHLAACSARASWFAFHIALHGYRTLKQLLGEKAGLCRLLARHHCPDYCKDWVFVRQRIFTFCHYIFQTIFQLNWYFFSHKHTMPLIEMQGDVPENSTEIPGEVSDDLKPSNNENIMIPIKAT